MVQNNTPTSDDVETILHTHFIVDMNDLAHRLELPELSGNAALEAARSFPLRFPESLLNRVEKGNPRDPILVQFFPAPQELDRRPEFSTDPLCEQKLDLKTAGSSCLMQKYEGRALIVTTGACAARCRFCFRRYFPQNRTLFSPQNDVEIAGGRLSESETVACLEHAFKPLINDPSISELIFSGGDPLTISNERMKTLLHFIRRMKYVKRVRFHSRVPVLTPKRIDAGFPDAAEFSSDDTLEPLILHIALHVNAPNEIDDEVARAILSLRRKGYLLTSQTVLLRGVNDSPETLARLYEKLINLGVMPYYLHQLDRIQGAAHFEVPVSRGRAIVQELRKLAPGYAVPRYVREIPGRPYKTDLFIEQDVD